MIADVRGRDLTRPLLAAADGGERSALHAVACERRSLPAVMDDLAAALAQGRIAGAGLDVFADEPHPLPALLEAPNTMLLPHVASASDHTRDAMGQLVVDNVTSWFERGRPVTPVPESRSLLTE